MRYDPFDLSGRTALVTGAVGGIGQAVCELLASFGANIFAHHLDEEPSAASLGQLCENYGVEFSHISGDLRETRTAHATVEQAYAWRGRLDIVVNNAGVLFERTLAETTSTVWQDTIAVNLTAPFLIAQSAAARMVDGGAIVNVASRVAFSGNLGVAAYGASKAGLVGLTRSLAREIGPRVRVNAIAPGPTATPLIEDVLTPEWAGRKTKDMVTSELAQPRDIAPAVLFLCSDAGRLFHGQTLHPNGGGLMP